MSNFDHDRDLRSDPPRGNLAGRRDNMASGMSVAVIAGVLAVLVIVALMIWTPWNDASQVTNRGAPATVGSSSSSGSGAAPGSPQAPAR